MSEFDRIAYILSLIDQMSPSEFTQTAEITFSDADPHDEWTNAARASVREEYADLNVDYYHLERTAQRVADDLASRGVLELLDKFATVNGIAELTVAEELGEPGAEGTVEVEPGMTGADLVRAFLTARYRTAILTLLRALEEEADEAEYAEPAPEPDAGPAID